jgi:hypothetical protein
MRESVRRNDGNVASHHDDVAAEVFALSIFAMPDRNLDYATPPKTVSGRRRRWALHGIVIGSLITVPAVCGSLLSAGSGHGRYVIARLAYPVPMLVATVFGHYISIPIMVLAVLQFPIYGAIIGRKSAEWERLHLRSTLAIAGLHATSAAVLFSPLCGSF